MYLSNIECINSILVGAKLKINILTANTFPANRHSPPCCRLDTSLLSAAQQGAEHRSARKVISFNISLFFLNKSLVFQR